ncbi:MAG: EscU/YscU/HrcU family type III secretion system export apparatus switch protein [bacterium]
MSFDKKDKNQKSISSPVSALKAVAMQYEESEDEAPRVTARGSGELAEKIIELARQNQVPLYEDKDLVELLYQLDLEEQIPVSLYEVVAEIFSFLYQINEQEKVDQKDGG